MSLMRLARPVKRQPHCQGSRAAHSITAGVQRFGQCGFDFTGADAYRLVGFTLALALGVIGQTGTGRDQTTHYHVLFQAAQEVALAGNRRLGEYTGCLLERCRRDERLGGQRCLGDTQQHAGVFGHELVVCSQTLVLAQYRGQLHLIALDEGGVTRLGHFDLAQHLAQDGLDVLVVDLHALQAVNVLNLVDDVLGQGADAQQTQDVVRIARTVGDDFTLVDLFTFEHVQVTPLRNQLFVRIAAIVRGNDQAALALGLFTEGDGAADFCQDRGFLRTARFEQVGNARQTTGNVAGLRGFLGDTGDDITHTDLDPVGHTDQGVSRQEVLGRYVGTRQQQILAVDTNHLHGPTDVLAGSRTILRIEDFDVGQTGQFVGLTLDGDAFFHAHVGHGTFHFGNDRVGVRVPLGDDCTSVDLVAFLHGNHGTVRQLVALALTTELVSNRQLTGTRYRDQIAVETLNVLQVVQTYRTAILHLYAVGSGGSAGRTTDVERTHGQLGTRLTDRLGSNNTDRFTNVDLVTTCQVATVALGADAIAGFTSDRRMHDHLIDTVQLDEFNPLLVHQGTGWNDDVFGARLKHVTGDYTTQYTLTQRLNYVTAFNMRSHQQAMLGAAIDCGNHQILRYVYQTTSQVTGVSSFQRGIRKTLTSTVRRDEVLQNRQTFAEVRGDRRFDDRAVWLGHQTTHTSELTDLRSRTPRTGVGHHVHRVERLLLNGFAFAINHFLFREVSHHRFGHFVVGLGPEVDHLVVLLALGYQAGGVLRFDFFNFLGGGVNDARLLIRDNEVVHTNRHTRDRKSV